MGTTLRLLILFLHYPGYKCLNCHTLTGIFLENILKYQKDHSDKFGGAIFSSIRGLFNLFKFTIGYFQCGNGPFVFGLMGHFKF